MAATPTLPKAAKLQEYEKGQLESKFFNVSIAEYQKDTVFKIKPLTTHNEWLLVMPFAGRTPLILPKAMEYYDYGIVVGTSQTILTPSGARVPSTFKPGDVVKWTERAIVQDELDFNFAPYIGRNVALISERNVITILPPVKHEIVE
jgi:hypothetical protein